MNKKKVATAVVIGAIVVIAVIIWLLASGKVTVAWNGSGQDSQASIPRVCDGEVVAAYNQATYVMKRKGSSEPTIDKKGVNKLENEIKGWHGYQNDPTCQTILFWTAVQHNDYNGAKKAYDALAILHDENKFPDNALRASSDFNSYGTIVESMSPASIKRGGSQRG